MGFDFFLLIDSQALVLADHIQNCSFPKSTESGRRIFPGIRVSRNHVSECRHTGHVTLHIEYSATLVPAAC